MSFCRDGGFLRFCLSWLLKGLANRELVLDSMWMQEWKEKVQVGQECKESAGKCCKGLVPETEQHDTTNHVLEDQRTECCLYGCHTELAKFNY